MCRSTLGRLPGKAPWNSAQQPSRSAAGINAGDLVAVSVGLELPGSDRYPYTRGTVLGSGEKGWGYLLTL